MESDIKDDKGYFNIEKEEFKTEKKATPPKLLKKYIRIKKKKTIFKDFIEKAYWLF